MSFFPDIASHPFVETKAPRIKGMDTEYRINPKKLDASKIYFFFNGNHEEPWFFGARLQYQYFSPQTPIGEKYSITRFRSQNTGYFFISVPKEYKDTCKKVAEIYGLTIENRQVVVKLPNATCYLKLPPSPLLYHFRGQLTVVNDATGEKIDAIVASFTQNN